jgi:diguanylate cyclase (GGDEF)-like protein/PAS domain S-box-containing protein
MTPSVATEPLQTTLGQAARRMAQERISSLIVTGPKGLPEGIITERDLLAAFRKALPQNTPVSAVMSTPLRTARPHTSLFEAYRVMIDENLHHLVILEVDGRLAGIVSDSDFRPYLARCHHPGRDEIRFLMNPYIPTLSPEASVGDATALMLGLGATCVVIEEHRKPLGIFTMRDLVRLFEGGEDTHQKPLQAVMTAPVHVVSAQATPGQAWAKLDQLRLRHLVVCDEQGLLVGLITQQDLLRHRDYSSLIDETRVLARMTAELSQTQTKLRSILDSVTDFIGLLSPEGTLLEVNQPALRLIGIEPCQALGLPFWQTRWWENDANQAERVRKAIVQAAQGQTLRFETIHRSSHGNVHVVDFAIRPVHDDEGHIRYLLASGRDISHEKRQAFVREGQSDVLEMVARGDEPIRRILLAIVRLLESAEPEISAAILLLRDDRFSVEAAPRLSEAIRHELAHTPLEGDSLCAQALIRGQRVLREEPTAPPQTDTPPPQLSWAQPIITGQGQVLGVFALFYRGWRRPTPAQTSLIEQMAHLTAIALERLASQRSLESERGRLLALIDAIPDLVFFKDVQGHYLSYNQAFSRFFNVGPHEVVGKTDHDLIAPELAQTYQSNDRMALAAGAPVIIEEWVHNGNCRPAGTLFETIKAPVIGEDGALMGIVGVARDITNRKDIETRLRLAASVFAHSHDGILITSPQGRIVEANQAFLNVLDLPREHVVGKNLRHLELVRRQKTLYVGIWGHLRRQHFWQGELSGARLNGGSYAERLTLTAVRDAQQNLTHYVGVLADITDLKESQARLERMAHYDALTRLPNRTLLSLRMQTLIHHALQTDTLLGVCYLDLDGFKPINDTHGHHAGDALLMKLAQRMTETLRSSDTVARLGGDEFVILLANLATVEELEAHLRRLLLRLGEPTLIEGLQLQVSASIGVTIYPLDSADPDTLLRHADQAMYQAKAQGRAGFHLFDLAQEKQATHFREVSGQLTVALLENQLQLYYQPKVDLQKKQVMGFEALLRWQHPERGLLAPGYFLPVVQETPFACKIDEWVLETALHQLGAWKSIGLDTHVSINISARTLQRPDLPEWLAACLARHPRISPSQLELEVLESCAMDDIEQVGHAIRSCANLGVGFALDDFGTGYSSLIYLRRLPAGVLKIDRSFVNGMLNDAEDLAIVESVLGLATAFGRQVIAEGVETRHQGERLLAMGCRLIQGYGIARPMPASQVPDWIHHFNTRALWTPA